MDGDKYVHAWILRLAATVLGHTDGDTIRLVKELNAIADKIDGAGMQDEPDEEPSSDGFAPDDPGDGWDSSPDIRDLEVLVGNKGWHDIDDDYVASLSRFAANGLTVDQMTGFAKEAYGWRYFCGMCWRTIKGTS